MLKKSVKCSLLLAAILSVASVKAAANSITCSGGNLYVELAHPDGEICIDTRLHCSGEWSCTWIVVKKGGYSDSGDASQSSEARVLGDTVSLERAQEIVQILRSLKQSDLKLFYQAPSSIVASFKKRTGWPVTSKDAIEIPEGTLPSWLEDLARKKPSSADMVLYSKGYPPHGYPCLGCHPCPPDYCDNNNKQMQESDLAPEFLKQGYRVKDGKIVKVAKAAKVAKATPDSINRKK